MSQACTSNALFLARQDHAPEQVLARSGGAFLKLRFLCEFLLLGGDLGVYEALELVKCVLNLLQAVEFRQQKIRALLRGERVDGPRNR